MIDNLSIAVYVILMRMLALLFFRAVAVWVQLYDRTIWL